MKIPCPASISGTCLILREGFFSACQEPGVCEYEPDDDEGGERVRSDSDG